MKYTLPLFALSLLLTACNKTASDDSIRRQLIGTWTEDGSSNIWIVMPDGSFDEKWTNAIEVQGTWAVKDGLLYSTVTNRIGIGSTDIVSAVSIVRPSIIEVDNAHLRFELKGQTNHWERKK